MLNHLIVLLKRICAMLSFAVALVIFLPICCLLALLPASIRYDNRVYYTLVYYWNWILVRGAFLKLEIVGAEHIPVYPNNPSIIIANHSSAYDIYLTEVLMRGYPHIWLLKAIYTKVPFFGFLASRQSVAVDKKNPFKAAKSFLRAYELAAGNARHLVLFPEGTRHTDGTIHEFHSGFALLAKKLGRPVIPICIQGMHEFMPKGTILVDPRITVHVIIGQPVLCGVEETTDAFTKRMHDWFCKKIKIERL